MGKEDILEKLRINYEKRIENMNNVEGLLNEYSPWTKEKIKDLSKEFIDALKNRNYFSWLKVEDGLLSLPKHKEISIDYGIPTHVHGDIENATLFLCLVNPNIEISGSKGEDIRSFYEKASKINSEDISLKVIGEDGNITIDDLEIEKYIVDIKADSNILSKETNSLRLKFKNDKNTLKKEYGYYFSRYFPQIIISYMNKEKSIQPLIRNLNDDEWDRLEKMTKKIVNLEAFPFRSKNPGITSKSNQAGNSFANSLIESDSKVNLLSSRIIIWRIAKYLSKSKDDKASSINKPTFIFRRFNAVWLPSLQYVLVNDEGYSEEECFKVINELHDEFFLTINKKSSNARSGFVGKRLFRNDNLLKEDEFDEFVKLSLK